MVELPFDKNKSQKLKLERSAGEKWGFTVQTYGLRLLEDTDGEVVHYVTFVDYVELFSRAYEGGLRAGDIIIGITVDGGNESWALQLHNAVDSLLKSESTREISTKGEQKSATEPALESSDSKLPIEVESSKVSQVTVPVSNSTNQFECSEPIYVDEAFANHEWVAKELRKAERELRVRIVREECVSKLQLFQRRMKLQALLALKRRELEQLDAYVETRGKQSLRERERGRKSRASSSGSDRQLITSSKSEDDDRLRRKSRVRANFFGGGRRKTVESPTIMIMDHVDFPDGGSSARLSVDTSAQRHGVSGAVAASFAEFDRVARSRSRSIVSIVDIGFRLHIDALAQRQKHAAGAESDGEVISKRSSRLSVKRHSLAANSRVELRLSNHEDVVSVSDIHAQLTS